MSDLVGTPEDHFSRAAAYLMEHPLVNCIQASNESMVRQKIISLSIIWFTFTLFKLQTENSKVVFEALYHIPGLKHYSPQFKWP